MRFHTIFTHESPDLDAMLCCYLLQKHGESQYPGIGSADIRFCPAGLLPDNKTPEELESEGILVVDMGGGRLDTHPSGQSLAKGKLSLAAANLVATDLGIAERPALKNLLEFVRLHDSMGKSLSSRNPVDHLVALPNLVRGGSLYFKQDFSRMVNFFMDVFVAIERANEYEQNNEDWSAKNSCLLARHKDFFYIPLHWDLKPFFAGYLCKNYLQQQVRWEELSLHVDVHSWDTLADFLDAWGLYDYPELNKLIMFVDQLKPNHYLLDSTTTIDQTVSLTNIFKGFQSLYGQDPAKAVEHMFVLFDCVLAYERSWNAAVREYNEKRQMYHVNNLCLVAISAESGTVIKVARWQDKADITVFQDVKETHISISLNQLGRTKNYSLKRLAARIRAAEIVHGGVAASDSLSVEIFFAIGEAAGWFLHQSEKLLLHGSPKGRREPSHIPFDLVVKLTMCEFDDSLKLPDELCPPDRCLFQNCAFYALRLPNCFTHREALRNAANVAPAVNTSLP
jgi:hypothetical protein